MLVQCNGREVVVMALSFAEVMIPDEVAYRPSSSSMRQNVGHVACQVWDLAFDAKNDRMDAGLELSLCKTRADVGQQWKMGYDGLGSV
jgi:hypothetical protein